MTSTLARGAMLPELAEPDSDGSSGEDREFHKRLQGDLDSSGPKKRRKQSTPVRFPASLIAGDRERSDEDEESEGKPMDSPRASTGTQATCKDENLNNEFRCQYCSHFFDSKEILNLHLDSEHNEPVQHSLQHSPLPGQIQVKQEQEQSEAPVNLTGLSIKSFAASWLSGHVQSQAQNEDWQNSVSGSSLPSMPNHPQGLSFPGALAQYLPLPGFSLADSSQIPRPPIGPAPVRIFNLDAYCDLCNKEFCNKYFLKTHKANKHGIYVDTPGSNVGDASAVGSSYVGSFSASNIKLEQSQRLEIAAAPPPPAQSVLSAVCEICQKRFKNEDSVRKHKQKVHNETTESADSQMITPAMNEEDREASHHSLSPGAMESLFKQEFGVEQEDSSYMPAPRHLSPQSVQQARDSGFNVDRLRRLGVINPDAFCEICCKEYCNKYFLRTHKMKRHGIYLQDSEKSPSNPAAAASWHQIQTSPLNLIVTEATGNSSESGDRLGEDYECKPCGIRFQTSGLYQAHRQKLHENEELRSPKQDFDAESSDQRADSISEDLQKLQTMILQLNGLESSRGVLCAICGKEFDTKLTLRAHMATEHGAVVDDSSSPLQATEKSPNHTTGPVNCTLCDKEYQNHEALRKHITEDHQPSTPTSIPLPLVPTIPNTVTSTSTLTPQLERKPAVSMTPTSSYCEICNKELCNKYFMKTHMQRMHGIEIENGAQIGGVICNICNKELCSKYFLRVHKHNTHGIIEEGTTGSTTKQADNDASSTEDSALKPEQLGDLSHRYFTHFTEVCPICSQRFRSTKWLKAHLMSNHAKAGIDKWRELEQQYQTATRGGRAAGPSRSSHQNPNLKIPNGLELSQHLKSGDYTGFGNQVLSSLFGSTDEQQLKSYRCSYCSFTTTVLPFLFLHERSHASPQGSASLEGDRSLQCPICQQGFSQPELLHHHLLTQHHFPGLLSHIQSSALGSSRPDASLERDGDSKDRADVEAKDDRRQGSPQTSMSATSSDSSKLQRHDETAAVQVTPQGAYKCAQCGYATANLNRIKKHIKKDHRTSGDPAESVITELSRTLKDVANKHKVPASYAMPQDMKSNQEKTIMQPFLIEECETAPESGSEVFEKQFGPALVYLPVRSRVNTPVTASFTLSPA